MSVAVASHDRAIRLRWLLNALEEQTLDRAAWEVVVAHDSSGPQTDELLAGHPLARDGTLRHLRFAPGSAGPAAKRNAAWRRARAPVVAFTDDDCRPPAEWLERLVAAAEAAPGAIVQGAVQPDPDEAAVLVGAPHARTVVIDPPTPWGQTANIAYPRDLLERLGGFDERFDDAAGEDTELFLRARAARAPAVPAPAALTYHCVEDTGLRGRLRVALRWSDLPLVVRTHPQARRHLPLGVFWKPSHGWLALAAAGAVGARGRPPAALLAVPYAVAARPRYGPSLRGRVRSVAELPGRALVDAAEMLGLARGSIRHRSLLL